MGPIIIMFLIFYFLIIRPQQKKQREIEDWRKALKKGDEVVTTGGLIGRIATIQDNIISLDLSDKVRVRVLRSHIAGKGPQETSDVKDAVKDSVKEAKAAK
jgi:preprotein translocase subunit YajC